MEFVHYRPPSFALCLFFELPHLLGLNNYLAPPTWFKIRVAANRMPKRGAPNLTWTCTHHLLVLHNRTLYEHEIRIVHQPAPHYGFRRTCGLSSPEIHHDFKKMMRQLKKRSIIGLILRYNGDRHDRGHWSILHDSRSIICVGTIK